MLLSSSFVQAQSQAAPVSTTGFSNTTLFAVIILLAVVLLFQAFVIRRLIGLVSELQYKVVHGKEMPSEETTTEVAFQKREDAISGIFKTLTRSNPIGKQKDVMLEHDYDGIRELDNIMPPWLQIILYGSIIFAIIYLLVYHVYDIGKLPKQEYAQELLVAQQQKDARLKSVGASLDESSVKQLNDAASLDAGKTIFITRCSPCHGQHLEGNVGPNLTDDYWLHGGSVNDIFKTVKYGVPAKGMVPWQGILKPEEMQSVVSYVMSMHGSNPENGKAPQGVLYSPQTAASDSTTAKTDSTKTKS
jgi:cytochrome c oxidase cbb3-type subunit 3